MAKLMATIIKSDPRAREKPCLRCGYSLRRIPDSKNCPECGLAIWISLSGHETFDLSNPEWIRKLRNACGMMGLAEVLTVLAWLVPWPGGGRYESFGVLFCWMMCACLYCAALGLLSWPEKRYPDKLKSYRLIVRVMGGTALVFAGLGLVNAYNLFALLGFFIAAAICGVAPWPLLRKLAQRIPHPKLARLSGWLALVPGSSVLLLFPVVGLIVLSEAPWIIIVLLWVYFIGSVVMLSAFVVNFNRTMAEAKANWAKGG